MLTSRPLLRAGAFAVLNGMFYVDATQTLHLLDDASLRPDTWIPNGRSERPLLAVQYRPSLGKFIVRYNPSNHDPEDVLGIGPRAMDADSGFAGHAPHGTDMTRGNA